MKTVNEKIFEKWKKMWTEDSLYDPQNDYFYPLFVESYETVAQKMEYNKKMNFRVKKLYLAVFLLMPVGAVAIFILKVLFSDAKIREVWNTGNIPGAIGQSMKAIIRALVGLSEKEMDFEKVASYGIFLFIVLLYAGIIAKWLDIKKYQETWARHSDHKYKLDREMFRYVQGMDQYKRSCRRESFVKNVMKIWDENQNKFSKNMDEREAGMTDMMDFLKKII